MITFVNSRCKALEEKGLLYVGSGVSGGEEGARYGPSLMPGGHKDAWPHIKSIFQVIYWFYVILYFMNLFIFFYFSSLFIV